MNPIIEAKNVSKKFQNVTVLENINLKIYPKEILSVVGPSGAGKTTLLQILGTLEKPDHKNNSLLKIFNQNIFQFNEKKLSALRNQSIGFIFQFHELLPEFTALENVFLPALIAKKSKKEAKEKALFLLDKMNLLNRKDYKPTKMSGGEKQRIAVARALINNPKIIFADEPSGNLDSANAQNLYDLFFNIRKELGCSFIIVTHDENLANRADRKIILKDGQIQN